MKSVPNTPTTDALRTAETARIALAAEVSRLRHEVRQLRALRAHPTLEPVIDLVQGDTDEAFADSAAHLAAALISAQQVRRSNQPRDAVRGR